MTQPALFTPPIPTTPARPTAIQPATLYDLVRATGTSTGGRNAEPGKCRTCRAPILRGLDEDVCAFRAQVDPTPLTRLGEAMALLGGRKTYDLVRDPSSPGGRWQLTRRGRWRIAATTSHTTADIVPAHRCHDHTLDQLTTPTVHTVPAILGRHDTCPY